MYKQKRKSILIWIPTLVSLLYLAIAMLSGFNMTFVFVGGGVSIGFSIGWIVRMLITGAEPQEAVHEDVEALREIVRDVKAKTDVIYGDLEKLCSTIAGIDVRTERINEIAIDIGYIKALQQSGHAREENDVLTSYINAFLTEYGRLKAELDESKCNAAYLSKENASLACRIRTLNQLLEQQKTENNCEEKEK